MKRILEKYAEKLDIEVNKLMDEGWQPLGGLAIISQADDLSALGEDMESGLTTISLKLNGSTKP